VNMNISRRDKKVLIAGIVFVVCYLLFFFVAEPIYKKQAKTDDKIKTKVQFIQKYYEVLNQKSYYQEKEKNHPVEKFGGNHHVQTYYFFINVNMCSKSFHQKTVVAASAVIFKRNPGVIPRVRTITANNPIRPSTNTPDTGCRASFSSCIYIFTMSRR